MAKRRRPIPATLPNPGVGPTALPPTVHIPAIGYRPGGGENITRQAGTGPYQGQIIYVQDPGAPTSGSQTYRYGQCALNPNVRQILNLLESGPFWTPWHIAADNDYTITPDAQAIDMFLMQFINNQLQTFTLETFTNILKAIWIDSYTYGFSVSEFVWHDRDVDGYTWLRAIKPHSPYLFDIYTDQTNELASVFYRQTGQTVYRTELESLLIVTYPYVSHGNYYGTSGLISVYPDVVAIDALEKAQYEGARSLSIKALLHHYESSNMSDDQVRQVVADLEQIQAGSVISFPASIDKDGALAPMHQVSVVDDRASAQGLGIITTMLDTLYKRVSRNMGLPDDLGFTGTNVGSLAKATEESNLYLQTLVEAQNFIAQFVNRQIIPLLVKYNFPEALDHPTYRIPKFTFATVDTNAAVDLDPLIAAFQAGLISRTEFRKAAGYEAPLDPTDTATSIAAQAAAHATPAPAALALQAPTSAPAAQLARGRFNPFKRRGQSGAR